MGKMTIQKPLYDLGWDMFNYLTAKEIDRFYTIVNVAERLKRTSKIVSRGIIMKINFVNADEGIVSVSYINNTNDFSVKNFECNISELKKAVAKAYKSASAHFFS